MYVGKKHIYIKICMLSLVTAITYVDVFKLFLAIIVVKHAEFRQLTKRISTKNVIGRNFSTISFVLSDKHVL